MELPDIGKQCAHPQCKQLDFLPLNCKCGKTFCSDHFTIHAQECEVSKILSEDELKKIENVYICSHPHCKERSIVALICKRCKQHFCVQHRHLAECKEKDEETLNKEKEKYAAPVRIFNEAKAVVDKQVEKNLADAKKKPKNREMANKVQLMKIKNKATGLKTIPTVDRVYFSVSYCEKSCPVFVSSQWSLGRAIDAIAEEMKLQNNNNKANEKKLRLFTKEDNVSLSTDMSVTIKKLLGDKILIDGDTLLIKYVDC
ncbi:AN1-type zinc finger protein 1-like [Diabrotica virgifera virgifera]|uniref:AN1-type domain-containing protein n=1 Tax=Diabrotica virgifera virgifera TaxID=50390 RepID=A0ABM5JKD6_DIAVI|nr:AN1-type zinc finger protein 1-like [Diabrotica virgifera virgifera]